MKNYITLLFVLPCFIFFSCNEENVRQVIEEVFPNEIDTLVVGDESLRFSLDGEELYNDRGNLTFLPCSSRYNLSTFDRDCEPNRCELARFSSTGGDTLVPFAFVNWIDIERQGEEFSVRSSSLTLYLNETPYLSVILYSPDSTLSPCIQPRPQPTVAITESTEEVVRGTITGLAYSIMDEEFNQVECTEYERLGLFELAFSLKPEICE